jgi:glutamine amidotransferase
MPVSKVAIVDYGLGNLRSVAAATAEVGGSPEVTSDPDFIQRADRIILPGVGAFGAAAKYLDISGIGSAVVAAASQGAAVLGICLGMQLLFDRSNEFGWAMGLGLVQGDVLPILGLGEATALRGTHIGWRRLEVSPSKQNNPLFARLGTGDFFYFVHSFSAQAVQEDTVLAHISYGDKDLVAAVAMNNVFGVQFHPEKSGASGLGVLKNFLQI